MEVAFYMCILFSVIFGCNTVFADRCLTSSGRRQYYYGDTKVCCNGTLYDRNKDSKEEVNCCGDVIYKALDTICCGPNSLHERYVQSGENQGKEQKCCGINIVLVDQIVGMACCGNNFTKNDGCCNQTTPFNKTHSQCVKNKVVPLGHDFCNGTLFDNHKQKCCEDSTLWNISSYNRHFLCCGSEVYDSRTKRCCGGSSKGKIQPKRGQCCGTGLYDSSQELCCKEQVFHSNGRLQCCGKGTYDPSSQECCGGRAMKKGLQICCNGTIYTIDHKLHLHCCGNNVYYSTTHLCCENRIKIEKTSPNHTSCCKRDVTSSLFYSCEKQGKENCGKQSYDVQTDLCCNSKIHKGARKIGKRCCQPGTLAFNPKNQKCCHNEVKRKTESCDSPPPPSPPRRIDRHTSGLCSIWSHPKPQIIRSISSTADVCRKNGYILKIENPIKVSNLRSQLQISLLNVTVKGNIYNSTNSPSKKEQRTLLIPSNCTNMEKRKSFLLLTDIVFHSSQNVVHLGDSDLIFPSGRNIVQIVRRRFKSCSSYIVRNIYKILSGRL